MIFLVEYSRSSSQLVSLKEFDDVDISIAESIRFEKELELNRSGMNHEVVLLEAVSEEALRRTHRRYFENLEQLATLP